MARGQRVHRGPGTGMTEPKERSWRCPQREELRVRIMSNMSLGRIDGGRDGDTEFLPQTLASEAYCG